MLETFQPLIDAATGIDLTDPETACTELITTKPMTIVDLAILQGAS